MIKEHLVYEDFDGNQREEDFYFNFTPAEITEMEWSINGGLSKFLTNLAHTQDWATAVGYIKEFLLKAYGERSNDGKYFVKNNEVRQKFESSMAYSELWMKFATEEGAFDKFVNSLIPKNYAEKYGAKEEVKDQKVVPLNNA